MTAALNRAERRKAGKMARSSGTLPSNGSVQVRLADALTEAVRQHGTGNLAPAKSVYQSILQAAPDHPDALHFLGVLLHQEGKTDEGIKLLERACAKSPGNPEIHANFGAVLTQAGRVHEAETHLRRALALTPARADVKANLVRLLFSKGDFSGAIAVCLEGLAADPDALEFRRLLGEALLKTRDIGNAAAAFRACLEIDPNDVMSMNNLAICCRELGDPAGADKWYGEAVKRAPDKFEIRRNYGFFLLGQGRTEEAGKHLDQVLAADPTHWVTLVLLAIRLFRVGRESEAIETLHRIAAAHPNDDAVWNDVGAQFMAFERFEEAAAAFKRATALDPTRVEPQTNLANAYYRMRQVDEAVREYEKALKIQPRHLPAHSTLCRALRELYRLDEANIYAHATLLLNDFTPDYFANPLQILRMTCDYDGLAEMGDIWKIVEKAEASSVIAALLQLLVYCEDEESTRRLAGHIRRYGSKIEAEAAAKPLAPLSGKKTNPKLRIGFLSSDLRFHSVGRFVLPLVEKYDRERFEIFCYCPIRLENDATQYQFKARTDKFTFVNNLTFRQVAETIRNDEVDILFELNGFTQGTQIPAVTYRPAPIQIAWLGYPFTTGMQAMDYILVDRYCKPTGDGVLVEKPLVMEGSWICFGEGLSFDPVEIAPVPPVDHYGVVTFGSLNNTYKYTARMIAVWSEVMKRVPRSRFLVVRKECGSVIMCRNIAKAFEANGISTDRIYFMDNRDSGLSHLAYYNEIDICLDTAPLTGGTTTTESLLMGVPVVTLVGPAMHQRLSYAILKHAGLDECCADTPQEFVDRAVALAENVARLRELRTGLRATVQASPLAQPELFVENFQAAMEDVARRHALR